MRRLAAFFVGVVLLGSVGAAAAPAELGPAARLSLAPAVPLAGGPPVRGIVGKSVVGKAIRRARQGSFSIPAAGPHVGASVLRRTALRSSPGGRVVVKIGRQTRFGGPQVLSVVARRGRWLGVLHQWMPNGRAGWVEADDVQLLRQRYAVEVDRSEQRALVRLDGKVVDRFSVGTGRPANPTPVGRFAVTDRLKAPAGSPYGCCILALSGTQPNLPQGWAGGDRLALHGTTNDQLRSSAGCLNARATVLKRLMRRIPVGTRVTIRP